MNRFSCLLVGGCLLLNGVPVQAEKPAEDPLLSANGTLTALINEAKARPVPARAPGMPASIAPRFDPNVPAVLRAQMFDDFAFVRRLRGDEASPLHRAIFGSVDGGDYLRYFSQRVKSVGVGGCGSGPAVACVKYGRFLGAGSSKMWLADGYTTMNLPQIYRAMVVFHEARHTEDAHGNWPHVDCPVPYKDENGADIRGIFSGMPLAGLAACDDTPIGAYGAGLIMLKNIEKSCASCTGKVRMDAGLYGDDTYKRLIGAAARRTLYDDLYR